MKHYHKIGRVISASAFILTLVLGAGSSRSQAINTAVSKSATGNYFVKIFGTAGAGKGLQKILPCTNGSCDAGRLKPGTYSVAWTWANGGRTRMSDWSQATAANSQSGASANSNSGNITITSKPADAATNGKLMHKPITITKQIDKASPMIFMIAAGDVDEDGMVDVTMTVKGQGATANSNAVRPGKAN